MNFQMCRDAVSSRLVELSRYERQCTVRFNESRSNLSCHLLLLLRAIG